jgi:hypothetical protein
MALRQADWGKKVNMDRVPRMQRSVLYAALLIRGPWLNDEV